MKLNTLNREILTEDMRQVPVAYIASKFIKILDIIGKETKELLLAYLIKTPGPFVKIATTTTDYFIDPSDENLTRLGYAIIDASKMPVAFIGLGYVAVILPFFGVSATGMLATKLFGWLAYALYRVASNHPKYRHLIKKFFPQAFLPKDLKQEAEDEQELAILNKTKPKPIQSQTFRPRLEELPKRESLERIAKSL